MGLKKKLLLLGILCMAAAIGPAVRLEQTVGGGAVMEISQKPPLVALTFDDGPRNSTTGRLLEGLALREVPATFFLVGSRIPGSESLIQ